MRERAHKFPVVIAAGLHLFPFRTEQLSPPAPMVLGAKAPGRVGRRPHLSWGNSWFPHEPPPSPQRPARIAVGLPPGKARLRPRIASPPRLRESVRRLGAVKLRDDEIVLREWRMEDAPAIERACQDPEIAHWIPFVPRPYTRADAEEYLAACLQSDGERFPFAIVDPDTDELLGSIDMGVNAHGYRGHIGYWVARDARGRGVCTRALRLLARWALDELRLERLELITDPDNEASQRVAEKVGFRREGVLRAHLKHPDGRLRDSVMFSLLPGELRD
jgi:RimJ/RimL family protein N-acetyltransferase